LSYKQVLKQTERKEEKLGRPLKEVLVEVGPDKSVVGRKGGGGDPFFYSWKEQGRFIGKKAQEPGIE